MNPQLRTDGYENTAYLSFLTALVHLMYSNLLPKNGICTAIGNDNK